MKPRVKITDKRFIYRNAASSDVRKTWAEAIERERITPPQNVRPLIKAKLK